MKERPNLTQFMEQLIRALKEEERFSTAHIYQSTLNALRLFCKADVIRFNQMDRSRLKQFESHLRNKGCAWNTVSTYMRTLQAVYNRWMPLGSGDYNPKLFDDVYTKVESHIKRALTEQQMKRLMYAEAVPISEEQKRILAYFVQIGRASCRERVSSPV